MDSVQSMPAATAADPSAVLDILQEWKDKGDNVVKSLMDTFSGIDSREKNLRLASESLAKRSSELEERERKYEDKSTEIEKRGKELNVIRGLLERRLDEVSEKLKKFDAFWYRNLEEVALREKRVCEEERVLNLANGKFLEELTLREESLCKKEKEFNEKLLEIALREESLLKKEKEFELSNEKFYEEVLTLREEVLCKKEREFEVANKELKGKQQELDLREERLCKKRKFDMDFKPANGKTIIDKNLKEIESREMAHRSLSSKLNEANAIQELLEKRLKKFVGSEQRNIKDDQPQPQIYEKVVAEEGQQALQNDRKTLEMMFIDSDMYMDMELMKVEIRKILTLSSDPAKLVLDTVQGFYKFRSIKKLDAESRVRRATIILLDQLTKMCPKIERSVAATAVELAFEWKSTLRCAVEDEVLGFLHLVAAFNLSSHFGKKELFRLLKMVVPPKNKPELCHRLGLSRTISGHIEDLMSRKDYLLASIYTHEYQLQHKFKQASFITKYINHSKQSANARARSQGNTYERKDKAIALEIADLHVAVAHIVNYGLQSEYPPNVLSSKIQQLEADRASFKHGSPPNGVDRVPHPRPDGPFKRHKPDV